MRVVRLHSDWVSALGGSWLDVRGSFRRVLNVELPIAAYEDAADGAGGEGATACATGAVRKTPYAEELMLVVPLWIGARTCPFGPGAMLLDCDEMPTSLRRAEAIRVILIGEGRYELRVGLGGDSQGRFVSLPLGISVLPSPATPLGHSSVALSAMSAHGVESVALLNRWGNPDSPFVSRVTPEHALRKRLQKSGEALTRMLAEMCAGCLDSALSLESLLARFVGLGPGLTPSADDFTVGALAAWRFAAKPSWAAERVVAEALMQTARGTTGVSQLYLRAAARGEFSDQVVCATQFLFGADKCGEVADSWNTLQCCDGGGAWLYPDFGEDCPQPIADLLTHGSTSGTDTLAGMAYFVRALGAALSQNASGAESSSI